MSDTAHGANLLKDNVDAACQPLFSINVQLIYLLHQVLHRRQRQRQLAIHFLQQLCITATAYTCYASLFLDCIACKFHYTHKHTTWRGKTCWAWCQHDRPSWQVKMVQIPVTSLRHPRGVMKIKDKPVTPHKLVDNKSHTWRSYRLVRDNSLSCHDAEM